MIMLKARLPTEQLNAQQKNALAKEIRCQCIEQTKKYEVDLDTIPIYILHTRYEFTKEQIEEFYSLLFTEREEMKKFFEPTIGETESDIDVFAMRYLLKEDGIDVEKMYHEQEKHNFVVSIAKGSGQD